MPKLRLTIDEMQKLLLAEIRSRPRCAGVASVAVKQIGGDTLSNNWTIGSIAYGRADSSELVDKAAVNAQARISQHYDLTDD